MQSSCKLEISDEWFKQVEDQLVALGNIADNPIVKGGMLAALKATAVKLFQLLPKPGYPGDKPGLKALRDTIEEVVKKYGAKEQVGVLVGLVGFAWGAGSHGHIVEEGHRIAKGGKLRGYSFKNPTKPAAPSGVVAGFVEGKHYLQKAAELTNNEREDILSSAINRAIYETTPDTAK